jgi:hypothetical protein
VASDIDVIRGAMSSKDFHSRCACVRAKWVTDGLPTATAWSDKEGRQYDFVSSFFKQWETEAPEWYIGAADGGTAGPLTNIAPPGTNNGAESCIEKTRLDAGSVVGSVGQTLNFLLQQVESVSTDFYNPYEERPIANQLWQKACAFRSLFNTNKILAVPHANRTYYCCSPRSDPSAGDVRCRLAISRARALSVVLAFVRQMDGAEATMSELLSFAGDAGVRIFGYHGDASFCTCPAFYAHRQCFHIKGLQVFIGIATPPEALDATPVAIAARGNKPKAPGRGAVPLRADQKDVRIAHLEAQLRKLISPKSQAAKKRPHSQVAQVQPVSWSSTRRLKRKTSHMEMQSESSRGMEL